MFYYYQEPSLSRCNSVRDNFSNQAENESIIMKELIIANWKMNPATAREAARLAKETVRRVKNLKNAEVVIVPPFVFLETVAKILKPITYNLKPKLGAQDVFWKNPPAGGGAYTGEVSPRQLRSLGVKYVIVGHSERRALGEADHQINEKIKAALKDGLKVILCVGEPLIVRRKGRVAAKRFVKDQLRKSLKGVSNVKGQLSNVVIAYEPVWAISSRSGGRSDTPEDAIEMAKFIKNFLNSKFKIRNSKLIYGGSVNSKNARAFLSPEEINGALIGSKSLNASDFQKIAESAA